MKYTWIFIILLTTACASNTSEQEENISEETVTEEMDDVDAMILKDKERLDSMEKVLLQQMENIE